MFFFFDSVNLLLYVYNVLYLYFVDLWDVSYGPASLDFILFDKAAVKSKLLHESKYLFNICLLIVGRPFCKLATLTIFVSSLCSQVKKRNIICSDAHVKWNIKGIARVFYSPMRLCGILHLKSTVGRQYQYWYCGWGRGGAPEIYYSYYFCACFETLYTY